MFLSFALLYLSVKYCGGTQYFDNIQLAPSVIKASVEDLPTFCDKKKIVFIKTHKTGSSTVYNILSRLAVKRNYSVACPPLFRNDHYWPKPFQSSWVSPSRVGFDMFMSHSVFNYPEYVKLFPKKDTFYFTILRRTAPQWISTLLYFDYDKLLGIKGVSDLKRFLRDNPRQNYTKFMKKHRELLLLSNPSLFDLGFDVNERPEATGFDAYIRFLNNTLDFVMFAEHFDESLLVLKKMLCLDDEDVEYVKINESIPPAQEKAKLFLSDKEVVNDIYHLNKGDVSLYKHFYKVMYPYFEQVQPKVPEFRRKLSKRRDDCVVSSYSVWSIVGLHFQDYKVKASLSKKEKVKCELMTKGELGFLTKICYPLLARLFLW